MTTQTFHLTIALGSEQMRSGDDVHRALSLVGADLANRYDGLDLPDYLSGTIRSKSGAEVGSWSTGEADARADEVDLAEPWGTTLRVIEGSGEEYTDTVEVRFTRSWDNDLTRSHTVSWETFVKTLALVARLEAEQA